MAQVVLTNVAAMSTQQHLRESSAELNTSLERLSSGRSINNASDNAAGLAISSRLTSQIRSLQQAMRNANDGVSLAQVAESAVSEMTNILQRIRELAVQSVNAANTGRDRGTIQKEVIQLVSEFDRVARTTNFNGRSIFDGTFGAVDFQVGANTGETISFQAPDLRATRIGAHRIIGAAATATATSSRVNAQSVTLRSSAGEENVTINAGDSAMLVAQKVNAVVDATEISATASTSIDVSFASAGGYTLEVTSDNSTAVRIAFQLNGTQPEDLADAVEAFNEFGSQTGTTAAVNSAGTGLTLTNKIGNDITLSDTTVVNAGDVTVGTQTLTADATADSVVITGQVTFYSDGAFGVTTDGSAGEVLTNTTDASTLQAVSTLDLTNSTSANLAIHIVDNALENLITQQALIGAMTSRFESTISTLGSAVEDFSATRSRIRDTDFAVETTNLTRSNILQQAGIAMLSQANSIPESVLALLQ